MSVVPLQIIHQMKNIPSCKLLIFISIFSVLYSCKYDTNEVYNSPVNKNVTPPTIETINLDFNNNDTIFICSPDVLNFSFKSSDQKIEAVILSIDNTNPQTIYSNTGVFTIDNNYISIGIHSIKLDVYTKTGTGSIAEHLDTEHFISSKSWILFNQELNTIINKTFANGFQKLYWTKCKSRKLIDYIIYNNDDGLSTTLNSNFFIDSSYLGDQRTMSVKARLSGNILLDWGTINIEDDLPKLKFQSSNANEYTINWDKPKYYNAIDTLKILFHLFYDTKNICLKKTTNIDDTSVLIDKSYFGCNIFITCQLNPKNNKFKNTFGRYEVYKPFVAGIKFSQFRKVFPISNDECIVDAYDSILRYSIPNKLFNSKIKNSSPGYLTNVCVSCKGKYLTSAMGLFNTDNFWASTNSIENYSFVNIPNQNISAVSNNGTGLSLYDYHTFNMFNLSNSEKLATYTDESIHPEDIKISSNGDYFLLTSFNNLILFQFKDNQITEVQRTSDFRFYEFDCRYTNQYLTWDGSKVFIKQLPNTIINEFAMTDRICNIDFYNNEMLTYSNGQLYVRSLIDGSLVSAIESKIDYVYIDKDCYLQNHTIFCNTGVLYNVITKK